MRGARRRLAAIALTFWTAAARGQEIRFTEVASGIAAPTDIQNAGDGSGRLFFVQQNGLIRIFRNGGVLPQPFLDIRSKTRGGGEQGLLGLAFPPGFASSGRFYVNYTDLAGSTIIARYRVTASPDVADPRSEVVLLTIAQPFSNHNGGQLRFGPDGYLYIGMGDGGSGGDPQGHGQNRASLLGKMLRVDVESEPGRVRVPPDNPFVNTAGARGEIWAAGLRNPWRFSFDRATGDLWIADVGQDQWEEVNFQPASSRGGENYGWNVMEGMHCFRTPCDTQGLTLPVAEYGHGSGCSVTGGFVYRGQAAPGLRGVYVYGDLCTGRIWGLERQSAGWNNRLLAASGFTITTFGEDEAGELYAAHAATGTIHRIEARPDLLPPCGRITFSEQHHTVPAGGAARSVLVSVEGVCGWAAAVPVDWIALATASGAGSGSLAFTVSPNGGPSARTASINVSGRLLHVMQPPPSPAQVFADVPVSHPFFDWISLLRQAGLTGGCTATDYCPDGVTTRGQMAVFIVRSLFGGDSFGAPAVPQFTDVPAAHPHFRHIQKLWELGITTGCTATAYCPDSPVTRGQMAVFTVRAKLRLAGGQELVYHPLPYFDDVDSTHPYFPFVQEMREMGITAGCTASSYCANAPTTRGQMAVFLVRAFLTP